MTLLLQVGSMARQVLVPVASPLQRHSIRATVPRFFPVTVSADTKGFVVVKMVLVPGVKKKELSPSTTIPVAV